VPVALVTAALLLSRRHDAKSAVDAVALVGLLNLAGLISMATLRIEGLTLAFDFYWRITLAVMLVVVCTMAILAYPRIWRLGVVKIGVAVALSLGIILPAAIETAATTRPDPVLGPCKCERAVERLVTGIQQTENLRHTKIAIASTSFEPLTFALFDELRRRGYKVYVPQNLAKLKYFGRYANTSDDVGEVWYLVRDASISELLSADGATLVSSVSPLNQTDESQLRDLQARLGARLRAQGFKDACQRLAAPYVVPVSRGRPSPNATALARLNAAVSRGGGRYAIIAFPPTHLPDQYESC
jgi:hypothetical protein